MNSIHPLPLAAISAFATIAKLDGNFADSIDNDNVYKGYIKQINEQEQQIVICNLYTGTMYTLAVTDTMHVINVTNWHIDSCMDNTPRSKDELSLACGLHILWWYDAVHAGIISCNPTNTVKGVPQQ